MPPSEGRTEFAVLGSGSGGNSVVLRRGKDVVLLDAGFSCRDLERRLRVVGIEPRQVGAVVLTHEHSDHCRGLPRFAQRFKPRIYGTRGTFTARSLRRLPHEEVRFDRPFAALGFEFSAVPVPHDAREPAGYVIEDAGGGRLALMSDLGTRTERCWRALVDLDALILESNHDAYLLETGPYPYALKRRVASRRGHLSNVQATLGVEELLDDRLRTLVLYHLSRTNNRPEVAEAEMLELFARVGGAPRLEVSEQFEPGPWLALMDSGVAREERSDQFGRRAGRVAAPAL